MKTRQAVLVEPRRFEIQEADVAPADDEVLVKTEGCGMCTSEMWAWMGIKPNYPAALGHEGYGTVVEVGKAVSRIRAGDRVTGLGMHSYADFFTQPEGYTMRLRPDLGQTHVMGEPLYCVLNVVRAANPTVGDCLALVGLGPMGLWALQALAGPILGPVIAVDLDDRKLELARQFGATHALNPDEGDIVRRVEEITDGRKADVVVEGTGGQAGVETAVRLLRPGNPRLVIMSSFKHPIQINMLALCGVAAEVIHAHPGIRRHLDDRRDHCRRTETLINHGVFQTDPLVSHRYPLDGIQTAFEHFESNRPAGYVKGIVIP
jgi:threonine dehydrogenase-like Zn-dependent dehydrogenase